MNNFDNIKKGDRVKIETHAGDFAEFTVTDEGPGCISSQYNIYSIRHLKSLEVVKQPLPTKPGMYRAEDGEGQVFMLDSADQWHVIYTKDLSIWKKSAGFVESYFHNFTRIEL